MLGMSVLLPVLVAACGQPEPPAQPQPAVGSVAEAFSGTTADNLAPIENGCMQDIYSEFGQGGGLNCTANDVQLAAVTNVTVTDDGCQFVGDTVTFDADLEILLTATTRHDVGIYLGRQGDALNGQCKIATLPVAPNNEACTAVATPFPCCTGAGTGTCPFIDIDEAGDDTKPSDAFGYCSDDNGSTVSSA